MQPRGPICDYSSRTHLRCKEPSPQAVVLPMCARTHHEFRVGTCGGTRIRSRNMSSTHEPAQLLEPSNLLEPLDLSEYPRDLIHPATGADEGASPQRFTRRTSGPSAKKRRSFVKPILIVAGALACYGAGTALPQLQT